MKMYRSGQGKKTRTLFIDEKILDKNFVDNFLVDDNVFDKITFR